jgi:G:T-mismatch repair DNA endonuclease (very short patch repair protein)
MKVVHEKTHMKSLKLQEEKLAEFLRQCGFEFEWDQRVYICDEKGRVHSNQRRDEDGKVYNRPDFVINSFLDRIVIISCDEHEHNCFGYSWDCELARMQKIMASFKIAPRGSEHEFDPRPIQWIRLNPNAFKIDGVTKKTTMKARYAKLLEVIHSAVLGVHYIGYSLSNGRLAHMESYLKEKLEASPGDKNLMLFLKMAKEAKVYVP